MKLRYKNFYLEINLVQLSISICLVANNLLYFLSNEKYAVK